MPEDAGHIEHTLARLARTVSDALTASGWQTRQLGPPTGAALTRTTQNGIMATAQLTLTPSRRGAAGPFERSLTGCLTTCVCVSNCGFCA